MLDRDVRNGGIMFLYIAIAILVPTFLVAAIIEFDYSMNKDDETVRW